MKMILCLFFRYRLGNDQVNNQKRIQKIYLLSGLCQSFDTLRTQPRSSQKALSRLSWWYYLQDSCFRLHVVQKVGSLRPAATFFSGNKTIWTVVISHLLSSHMSACPPRHLSTQGLGLLFCNQGQSCACSRTCLIPL